MTIHFHRLTIDNLNECVELEVSTDQDDFVDSNVYCIATAYLEPHWLPQPIYNDDQMVGFIMYGKTAEGEYTLNDLMIDRRYQGQGYARASMQHLIDLLKAQGDCKQLKLWYWPPNLTAKALYESLGFEYTGELYNDEEPVMILPISG